MFLLNDYFSRIFRARYFIRQLVRWDLVYRFRRSKMGLLWVIMIPFCTTMIIALIFGTVLKIPVKDYSLYVFSGFIVWDLILSSVIGASHSFLKAESYIKQFSHPLAIYPLREACVNIIVFMITLVALVIWVALLSPKNLFIGFFSLPLTLIILFLLSFCTSIITSHVHIRFRDYPYVFGILMNLLWYFSPVFFKEGMFSGNKYVHAIFLYNPITQVLSLVREPFLYGKLPSLTNYIYSLSLIALLALIATYVSKRYERNVIFYL